MKPRSAKAKGSNYERELAMWFSIHHGVDAKRALLSGGGRSTGGTDVEGVPHLHVEAKRTERFQPYKAMEQAEAAIAAGKTGLFPVVISRKNRVDIADSLVVMRLKDFQHLYDAYLKLS